MCELRDGPPQVQASCLMPAPAHAEGCGQHDERRMAVLYSQAPGAGDHVAKEPPACRPRPGQPARMLAAAGAGRGGAAGAHPRRAAPPPPPPRPLRIRRPARAAAPPGCPPAPPGARAGREGRERAPYAAHANRPCVCCVAPRSQCCSAPARRAPPIRNTLSSTHAAAPPAVLRHTRRWCCSSWMHTPTRYASLRPRYEAAA